MLPGESVSRAVFEAGPQAPPSLPLPLLVLCQALANGQIYDNLFTLSIGLHPVWPLLAGLKSSALCNECIPTHLDNELKLYYSFSIFPVICSILLLELLTI
jgi:hypothetical protein